MNGRGPTTRSLEDFQSPWLLTPYPSPGMIPPKYVPHLPKPKELADQRRRGLTSGPQAGFGSPSGTNTEVTTAPRNGLINEYITAMGFQNHAKIKVLAT